MAVFMFWNTAGSLLYEEIRELCREHAVDVAIFAEQQFDAVTLITTLNDGGPPYFTQIPTLQKRLSLYTRWPIEWFEPRHESGHFAIQQLRLPIALPVLLVSVHLPSKLHTRDEDQAFYARNLSEVIAQQEDHLGHRRTIVIGDFNMDPFEVAMTTADGFHSLMDKRLTPIGGRSIGNRPFQMFYNPMWSLLGDHSRGPPGTYFYNSGRPLNYYWHTFDQILLRPELLTTFENSSVRVATRAGDRELLRDNGRIDNRVSDHLPIVVKLEIEGRL